MFEVVIGALAQAVPDDVVAACSHFANPTWGGYDPARGRRFVTYDLVFGGTGARSGKEGMVDAVPPSTGTKRQSSRYGPGPGVQRPGNSGSVQHRPHISDIRIRPGIAQTRPLYPL